MTILEAVLDRTGPAVAEEAPSVPSDNSRSGRNSTLEHSDTNFRLTNATQASERWLQLGFLLAQLRYVPFEDISVLLGIHDDELVKMLHGERPITRRYAERWEQVQEVFSNLGTVFRMDAFARWLNVSVPDLQGSTPLEAVRRGKLRLVLELSRSYLDPSYK